MPAASTGCTKVEACGMVDTGSGMDRCTAVALEAVSCYLVEAWEVVSMDS